jgi:hypothetical protein
MSVAVSAVRGGWGTYAEGAARRLAVSTAAGALVGLLVGGVGGRLAMMLLAALNAQATGTLSDDRFEIGQFTAAGTLNLLAVATVLGVLGGGVYAAVRTLMLGPRWFQVVSVALGPAVVVGDLLVHTDGVDFTLLQPAWLGVALFVALPAAYAALLTVLAERWLDPEGPFLRAPRAVGLAPLLLWLPIAPVLAILVLGWLLGQAVRQVPSGATLLTHPLFAWSFRVTLTVLFVVSLVSLAGKTAILT